MNTRKLWWLGTVGVVAVLIGSVLVVPAWAAPVGQAGGLTSDAYTAVHVACEARDVQGMTDAMNSLTDGDWQAMEGHMSDDHDVSMSSGMMSGWYGQNMMG